MYFKFDTDDLDHAKAALLLYGMYRSREKDSPLNGLETWSRFQSLVRGSCLKASNTAEFVQSFCKKAKIDSVKPHYLDTDEPVLIPGTDGELVQSEGVKDYRLSILADNNLLHLYNMESIYLIMLVRERIQREKLTAVETEEDKDNE